MPVPATSSSQPQSGKPSDIGVLQEDVVWLLGRAHDGPRTREREGSEWLPDFQWCPHTIHCDAFAINISRALDNVYCLG